MPHENFEKKKLEKKFGFAGVANSLNKISPQYENPNYTPVFQLFQNFLIFYPQYFGNNKC